MRASVIVPARNAEGTIGRCADALGRQRHSLDALEVIVVDDGSTDATAEVARASGAEVVTIPPSGPAVARNRGVAASSGDVVLFTDADCEPCEEWVERMARPFDDPDVIATKGVYRTVQRELTARFVQHEYESRYRRMRRPGRRIDFIDTYAAGFRRDLFDRCGGFDGRFPGASVEDQEFSFRYTRLPGRVAFVEDAVVTHRHARSPLGYFRKKAKIAYWKVRVMLRHPDKIATDAHTPQNVKLEMLSTLVLAASVPFAATVTGRWVAAGALAVFLASSIPLTLSILRRDPRVGLLAPWFQLLRALALGAGSLLGLCAVACGRRDRRTGETSATCETGADAAHGARAERSEREQSPEKAEEPVHELA